MKKMNSNFPSNWEMLKLSEISKIIIGQSPPSSTYNTEKIGLPFFQGKAEFTALYPIVRKWCSKPLKIADQFDILLSVRAPVGSSNIADRKCCIGRGLFAIHYPDCYMFLFYYFRLIERDLDRLGIGTTFKAISSKTINELLIPVPPLLEQKKIVEKIEELFSELDSGVLVLKKAKEQIKTYRQAVLNFAFLGKLTHDHLNPIQVQPDFEPSISKVAESQTQYSLNHDLSDYKINRIKSPEKSAKSLNPENPGSDNYAKNLPPGWKWVALGELSESMKNGIYKPASFYSDNGIACLRMYNIQNGKIDWVNIKRMNISEKEIKEYELLKGDILVNRVNSKELVGKSALIKNGIEKCIFESKNIRLRLKAGLNSAYTNFWLLLYASQYFNKNAQQTVGMASINQTQLSAMPIPVPPLIKQTLIVQEIEKRFSEADNLEKAIDESLSKAETLRQSILKQAFEGRLL
jgi:type I restriction enzyme S subunit